MGKVHASLARAGKVKGQTPKVEKQEKKKTRSFVNVTTLPDGKRRMLVVFVLSSPAFPRPLGGLSLPLMIPTETSIVHTESHRVDKHASKVFRSYLIHPSILLLLLAPLELHADEFFSSAGTPTRRNKSRARRLGATPIRSGRSCPSSGGGGRWVVMVAGRSLRFA
ncbi:hypothetical protein B0H14DRAFT_935654 [Mycena olivaceomarginata]|nr:hypothetical protein B0H14DRAFT_935654 [Mycena olivaceomarginata]